jgi:fibronectin-binding autotransporter adhesin
VISESGTSGGGGGGAGGTGGLGGAGLDAGGGAGWLGGGGSGFGGAGGLSAPTFAGGAGFVGVGNGGFGGGGGGSYLNPAMRDTIETPDFNGVAGTSPSNGYVIVGLTVFNYTGAVVEYTIPTTGFYYVAAVGAQGGPGFGGGGYGAGVGGSVLLDAGTDLDIVVGGAGMNNFLNLFNGGGGGGSFIWDPTAVPPQPVPEPSTWAMMLIGFGGLGYAGFRRRVALAATAGPA